MTGDERAAIQAELEGHIEDHMEGLMELGYDEALAEQRTLDAMGDPKEVGRELNRQYTGWPFVLLSRAAVLLTAVLCIQALLGIGILGNLWDSVVARVWPKNFEELEAVTPAATERLDIRIPVGNDVLRVYQVSRVTREGVPAVGISLCAYDRLPGGVVSGQLLAGVWIEDQRGNVLKWQSNGQGRGNFGAHYQLRYVPVEEADTSVTLRYARFGEDIAVEIPLPEVTP
ncbi:permease prefix domain 1-containing protein [Oscillibacter valericigenes]|uniref:permease prefix domain 1-containing protein n=1 Tax=Oscillibacter valericigenes TaxID=351091 RepID=UPI001958B32B